jgi:anti-anti-sigma regulatory factor
MKKIIISELIGKKLQSRIEAKKIYGLVVSLDVKSISLDFGNVTFMSRSFADEFCETINLFNKINVKIELINENAAIKEALNVVSSNRNKPKKVELNYSTLDFTNMNNLSDFLATI